MKPPLTIPWAIRLLDADRHVIKRSWTVGSEDQAAKLAAELLSESVTGVTATVSPI